jgi:hypothetical protein
MTSVSRGHHKLPSNGASARSNPTNNRCKNLA